MGPAGKGMAWHHIVEQYKANSDRFGVQNIQNTNNIIKLNDQKGGIHRKLTGYYNSKQNFSRPQTVRQWLSSKDFKFQFDFGIETLKEFGWYGN